VIRHGRVEKQLNEIVKVLKPISDFGRIVFPALRKTGIDINGCVLAFESAEALAYFERVGGQVWREAQLTVLEDHP
jgi:hypothetical protein